MSEQVMGVVIDGGAEDWQIFQQNDKGVADIRLHGRWAGDGARGGYARLMREDTNAPVAAHLDWTALKLKPDGTWQGVLKNVPAGGLYRLETHLYTSDCGAFEWSKRGDMRHCLGVGDLWVIAGQSNSSGYGRGTCYDPPELGVHLFNNRMQWALATHPMNESTGTMHLANREDVNGAHSPWLHWARRVKQEMGYPVGLVQAALGGSPLVLWSPAEPGDHPLYELMLQVVAAVGGKVRGVLWYQGESDTNIDLARSYEKRFVAAVRAWRKALANPRLSVLTVQINRVYCPPGEYDSRGWSLVREAQRQVPRRLANTCVVPTLDLSLSDLVHNSAASNMVLAERAAQSALGAFYGQDRACEAPEPTCAKAGRSGKTIDITFANVTSYMGNINVNAQPFAVEDAEGFVPVERIEYPHRTKVRLVLGRKLAGKAAVHGAWGTDPETMVCDVVRLMPALGFYGLGVE